MQYKDYSKYQEIEHLLLTQNDNETILQYMMKNDWIRYYDFTNIYILNLNNIYIDLIYGKENRLFNEFLYEYVYLEKDKVIQTIKYILSQIQTISTNKYYYTIIPMKTKKEASGSQVQTLQDYEDLQKTILQNTLEKVYINYKQLKQKKNNSIVSKIIHKLNAFKEGLILKKELIKDLVLKNGIYYKDDIPIFQQSQIEETLQQDNKLEIETQIYVSAILFEYFSFLEYSEKQQGHLIKHIQHIINNIIEEDDIQDKGAIDYYIRLTFLAIYKQDQDFDMEIYQKMLAYTERETLKFRQQIATKMSIDIDQIVQQWWERIKDYQITIESDDEEDVYEMEVEDFIAKQEKTS